MGGRLHLTSSLRGFLALLLPKMTHCASTTRITVGTCGGAAGGMCCRVAGGIVPVVA